MISLHHKDDEKVRFVLKIIKLLREMFLFVRQTYLFLKVIERRRRNNFLTNILHV